MNLALRKQEQTSLPDEPPRVIQEMADVMIACMFKKGTWEVGDLEAANFSIDDIRNHLGAACKIVERRPRPSER